MDKLEPSLRRKSNTSGKSIKILISCLLLIFIGFALINFLLKSESVSHFIFQNRSLKTNDGRVNVLLLGNAGGKHDGAMLTDTIMVASIDLTSYQVTFISIPRDLWLDNIKAKVNAAYEIGQDKGSGLNYSKTAIGDLLGLSLQYAIRLDFSGFEKAVTQVGGVDVEVANTFDDYFYPITGKEDDMCGFEEVEKDFSAEEAKALNIEPGKMKVLVAPDGKIATDSAEPDKGQLYFVCRYEHIHFNKGINHMDGATALKFVRSRHGLNGEGSDFARSRRQQKVIEAFRTKAFSLETLANPLKIKSLITTFGESFETDISIDDMTQLYGISKKITGTKNIVLSSDGKNPLLINPPLSDYGGAWVLIPKTKDFSEIQKFVEDTLKGGLDEASVSARPSSR